jgi:hypothetical protein
MKKYLIGAAFYIIIYACAVFGIAGFMYQYRDGAFSIQYGVKTFLEVETDQAICLGCLFIPVGVIITCVYWYEEYKKD